MTERAARHVRRTRHEFAIGPSAMAWEQGALVVEIDERAAPLPRSVLGRLRLVPESLASFGTALDSAGSHRWGPLAPSARIEVDLATPNLRWRGTAYLDSNEGDVPIEHGFERWQWQRAALPAGACAVHYDVREVTGRERSIAVVFDRQGRARDALDVPARVLPPTRWWRVARACRSEQPPELLRTLEDTPFYSRSLLRVQLQGHRLDAVHESLDVARLRSGLVQRLLPFRMPRRA